MAYPMMRILPHYIQVTILRPDELLPPLERVVVIEGGRLPHGAMLFGYGHIETL